MPVTLGGSRGSRVATPFGSSTDAALPSCMTAASCDISRATFQICDSIVIMDSVAAYI